MFSNNIAFLTGKLLKKFLINWLSFPSEGKHKKLSIEFEEQDEDEGSTKKVGKHVTAPYATGKVGAFYLLCHCKLSFPDVLN